MTFALIPLGLLVLSVFLSTLATAMVEDDPRGAAVIESLAADPWGSDIHELMLEAGLTRAAAVFNASSIVMLVGAVLGVVCCGLVFL